MLDWSRERVCIRYGIADSSPQKGKDWLLSSYDEICVEDVVPAFEAFFEIVRVHVQREELDVGPVHDRFRSAVRRCFSIPTALGSGATSLSHKRSSLLYAWSVGRPRESLAESLSMFVRSFYGFCSDMGTELGTAEYAYIKDISRLLPSWCCPRVITSDIQSDNAGDEGPMDLPRRPVIGCDVQDAEAEPAADFQTHRLISDIQIGHCERATPAKPQGVGACAFAEGEAYAQKHGRQVLMPNALVMPGTLHIIHNLLADVSDSLTQWDYFFRRLKVVVGLWKEGRK